MTKNPLDREDCRLGPRQVIVPLPRAAFTATTRWWQGSCWLAEKMPWKQREPVWPGQHPPSSTPCRFPCVPCLRYVCIQGRQDPSKGVVCLETTLPTTTGSHESRPRRLMQSPTTALQLQHRTLQVDPHCEHLCLCVLCWSGLVLSCESARTRCCASDSTTPTAQVCFTRILERGFPKVLLQMADLETSCDRTRVAKRSNCDMFQS